MSYSSALPRNTTTYLVAMFYSLKINYIVNISSFSVSHLVLHMYVPCSIVQVLWIPALLYHLCPLSENPHSTNYDFFYFLSIINSV